MPPLNSVARIKLATVAICAVAAMACSSDSPSPTDEAPPRPEVTASPSEAALSTPVGQPTSWYRHVMGVIGGDGTRITYACQTNGRAYTVWGTDEYTGDSSICTAAVHAGLISFADGGAVTVEIRPGQASYAASTRNGVESLAYGEWGRSFVFVTSDANLRRIVVTDATAPEGLAVHLTLTGVDAFVASDLAPQIPSGFVDAVYTEFDSDADHAGDHEGLYGTSAILFEAVADAQRAFDAAADNLDAPDGWGLDDPGSRSDPGLGEEGFHFTQGQDYGYPRWSVYLWRVDNVLLRAFDAHPYDLPGVLQQIVEAMDSRAQEN